MKSNAAKSLWWALKLQFGKSKGYFAWTIVNSIYDGIGSVLFVYASAKFLAAVALIATKHTGGGQAYLWLGIMIFLEIFGTVMGAINRLVDKKLQNQMEINLNTLFMEKMYELSQEQFDDQTFNTKLARAREAMSSMWRTISELSWMISSVVRFVSSIGAILVVAPLVGLVIIVMIIPVTMLRMYQNKFYEALNKKVEPIDRVAFRTRWMLMDPNTMPEIRLMTAFKRLIQAWRSHTERAQNVIYDADVKMMPADVGTDVIEPVVSVGATLYFLKLLIAGTIGLERFIFLRGLLEQASNSASSIVNSARGLHETATYLKELHEIYYTEPSVPNGTQVIDGPLTIEFKDVTFAYPRTKKPVLDAVSFLIVPGSKLALVGENGAGKSTLIKLLLRQYLPTSGTITVNGIDIKDVEQKSYYDAISNLSQDFLVVDHLSIEDNLLMGLDRKVDQKAVTQATDMVGATKFITALPHKYQQRLDPSFDDGTGLSGGQLQRLGVARALLREGDMLILDEPTSAIDAKAEYMIFNNIYKSHGQKTTLIVSHRFSTVRKADKIIVMESGKITEYGSHEELLQHGGLYKEMFEAQAEGYR